MVENPSTRPFEGQRVLTGAVWALLNSVFGSLWSTGKITKIGLIQNHPISRAVMLPWHFISGKPIVQDWGHLLEIGYHNFVPVFFQSNFLFLVFWKVNWGISRYICSDFWGIAKLGYGGWTFWWRKSHLIPQTLLKIFESTKCRNKYGCRWWWWQNFENVLIWSVPGLNNALSRK